MPLPIQDGAFYSACMDILAKFVGRRYHGRLVQIFLAAKFHGDALPSVGQGSIAIGELQALLDEFYRRESKTSKQASIAIIFQNNHLFPTGVVSPGLKVPSNIWRNNLGLQKAGVCFASEAELKDPKFLGEPRVLCQHMQQRTPGSLKDAKCRLNMGPTYRGEDGPKGIRLDPNNHGYSIVDPKNTSFWRDVVRANGRRLPVVPLISALYHDSEIAAGRSEVEIIDFLRDFNFTSAEFYEYFTDDPATAGHTALQARFPSLVWQPIGSTPVTASGARATARRRSRRGSTGPANPDDLPEYASRVGPPAGSHWWSAEQAVAQYLRENGWEVIDRTGQSVGFDLEARRPGMRRYVEVKSSRGPCYPVLTRNEHEAAKRHGKHFILAIVENYKPDAPVEILWIRDPAALEIEPRYLEAYPLPRSLWLPNVIPDIES